MVMKSHGEGLFYCRFSAEFLNTSGFESANYYPRYLLGDTPMSLEIIARDLHRQHTDNWRPDEYEQGDCSNQSDF